MNFPTYYSSEDWLLRSTRSPRTVEFRDEPKDDDIDSWLSRPRNHHQLFIKLEDRINLNQPQDNKSWLLRPNSPLESTEGRNILLRSNGNVKKSSGAEEVLPISSGNRKSSWLLSDIKNIGHVRFVKQKEDVESQKWLLEKRGKIIATNNNKDGWIFNGNTASQNNNDGWILCGTSGNADSDCNDNGRWLLQNHCQLGDQEQISEPIDELKDLSTTLSDTRITSKNNNNNDGWLLVEKPKHKDEGREQLPSDQLEDSFEVIETQELLRI